jgi:hypothetical protein
MNRSLYNTVIQYILRYFILCNKYSELCFLAYMGNWVCQLHKPLGFIRELIWQPSTSSVHHVFASPYMTVLLAVMSD